MQSRLKNVIQNFSFCGVHRGVCNVGLRSVAGLFNTRTTVLSSTTLRIGIELNG